MIYNQIPILSGNRSGGYFRIMPIKINENDSFVDVEDYKQEMISIEEEAVASFLSYFLEKYYDSELQYEELRSDYLSIDEFEWNLEYNFYSYDIIRKMLKEIEECVTMLKNDFYNSRIAPLINCFSLFYFDDNYSLHRNNCSKRKKLEIIKDNITLAIDFYNRFVLAMYKMMKNSPEYDLISFMGP